MPDTVRIATFNVENLFARYRFRSNFTPRGDDGFTINDLAFDVADEAEKALTAEAIKAMNAGIICLQEVDNLPILDRFHNRFLASPKHRYPYRVLIDGNDPRFIDLAVMSRYPITAVRTHRHERRPNTSVELFSRDCLEVEVDIEGKLLRLYINHFKSMMEGRAQTKARRVEQVKRTIQIINEREGPAYAGNFIALGDFNDYMEGATSLAGLVDHPQLVNAVDALPPADRWTHFWNGGGEYHQIDYVLPGKALFERAGQPAPVIERRGLGWRAVRAPDVRFDGIGRDEPKASDHCPVGLDMPFAALV